MIFPPPNELILLTDFIFAKDRSQRTEIRIPRQKRKKSNTELADHTELDVEIGFLASYSLLSRISGAGKSELEELNGPFKVFL